MTRLWSALVTPMAALAIALVVAASVAHQVRGESGPAIQPPSAMQSMAPTGSPVVVSTPPPSGTALDGLEGRARLATDQARAKGADISVVVLDRLTGHTVSNGNNEAITTASVAKLFIADDLLYQAARTKSPLSAEDRTLLDAMLRSSDDGAGEMFWVRGAGNQIVTRVAARYRLSSTFPGDFERWWNTITTASDLAQYYDMLLDGTGGLTRKQVEIIFNDLSRSTPQGIDGYPQRFGIPDGLYAEPVAVKQGWMCCIGADWMHLSTGVIGADRRYVMVIESLQEADDATARDTITEAVKTMFPGGHI